MVMAPKSGGNDAETRHTEKEQTGYVIFPPPRHRYAPQSTVFLTPLSILDLKTADTNRPLEFIHMSTYNNSSSDNCVKGTLFPHSMLEPAGIQDSKIFSLSSQQDPSFVLKFAHSWRQPANTWLLGKEASFPTVDLQRPC